MKPWVETPDYDTPGCPVRVDWITTILMYIAGLIACFFVIAAIWTVAHKHIDRNTIEPSCRRECELQVTNTSYRACRGCNLDWCFRRVCGAK